MSSSEGGGGSELCSIRLISFSAIRVFWLRTALENLRHLIEKSTLVKNYKPREEKFPALDIEELFPDIWGAGGENVDIDDPADKLRRVFFHQRQDSTHL